MPAQKGSESLLLPAGTRALYIGPPKSGTTAVQSAASAARALLYDYGVFYPGTAESHYRAIYAFMGRRDRRGKSARGRVMRSEIGQAPPRDEWNALMTEIDAEPSKRVLISHESAARATRRTARRFVDELGRERVHIVISLRPPADVLPSRWSELVKEGLTTSFEDWLRRLYAQDGRPVTRGTRRYLNQAGLVRRWASVAGPENVTVIVVDTGDRQILTDAFERLLGVPARTFSGASAGASNRSMTAPEAEVVRRVNIGLFRLSGTRWSRYINAFRTSALNRALAFRAPRAGETRLCLPPWAAERAASDGRRYARRIRETGVRVVGDLAALRTRPEAGVNVSGDIAGGAAGGHTGADDTRLSDARRSSPRIGDARMGIAAELVWGAICGGVDFAIDSVRIRLAERRVTRNL